MTYYINDCIMHCGREYIKWHNNASVKYSIRSLALNPRLNVNRSLFILADCSFEIEFHQYLYNEGK